MNKILFIDIEIEVQSKKVLDIGCISNSGEQFHSPSVTKFFQQISGTDYLCGHNIIHHDLHYLKRLGKFDFSAMRAIDTLYISPLLFPKEPYHKLLKDDKLQSEELNNPLNDAMKARDLFYDELTAFNKLDEDLMQIYFGLLESKAEFASFFAYMANSFFGVL